jgi:4-hydroxy-tetrahydrodipicolinate synthase
MPPYFFKYAQDDVREFYLRFADAIGNRIPIILYNIPFTTLFTPETVLELLSTGLFAGLKDSSGDWGLFEKVLELRTKREFTALVGDDTLFVRGRRAGADGGISGVACAIPELMVGLDAAILTGDQPKVERLSARLDEFLTWIRLFPTPVIVREGVALRGIPMGGFAVPLSPAKSQKLEEFRTWFKSWLKIVQEEAQR